VRLAEQAGPTATSLLVAVVDGSGRVVARSRDGQRFVGKPVPDWDKLKTLSKDKHLFEAQTAEGPSVIFAFEELADTPGWVLVVGEPLDAFNARWQHPLWQLAIGGCLALLLALLTARWVTRLILRPVRSLAHDARNVVSDDAAGIETPTRASAAGLPISEFESMAGQYRGGPRGTQKRAVQERQNAQQMARSELRYRTLAHAGAIWCCGRAARFVSDCGHRLAALTGAAERQALGWRWLKRVHPDDRRALRFSFFAARSSNCRLFIPVVAVVRNVMRIIGKSATDKKSSRIFTGSWAAQPKTKAFALWKKTNCALMSVKSAKT